MTLPSLHFRAPFSLILIMAGSEFLPNPPRPALCHQVPLYLAPHPRPSRQHMTAHRCRPDPIIAAPSTPRVVVPPPPSGGNQRRLSIAGRILVFFGYGRNNRARKELVSLICSLVVDSSQIIAIITLLTVSTHRQSPTSPSQNEWDACGKPLGTWDALWVVRLSLDLWLSIWRWSRERTKRIQDENPTTPGGRPQGVSAQRNPTSSTEGQTPNTPTPYPRIYARLSLMGSTFTLVWFVLVQILLFSSATTCRRSSPHLWWLTFGVLSVMYVMILEVVLVAILVFVVGPILFLFWSILLLCLGRHPSQNPHHFTPDIGQVPRAIVDKLPLVIYIPPPPDQPSKPVTLPSDLHTYPPKSPTSRRFFFLPFRRRNASTGNNTVKSGSTKEKKGSNRPSTWEDNWVKGEYPFVQLENHRASCAICLLDFQEPRRVSSGPDVPITPVENQTTEVPETRQEGEGDHEGDITEQVTTPATPATPLTPLTPTSPIGDLALRLQDAGEGAQPLRLLKCGHVFHKTCVDPWLLDVSGRCPVCQRPVRDQADATDTEQGARPERRRWFRRSRRRRPT
ncbi:hypothetical protein BGY98DRAFT_1089861 [Russula aff. rugulosa BPL654]|nr:hypothetical protein BGY98DRAFT_1089861 [Russula aff. rugulosa BPL654]